MVTRDLLEAERYAEAAKDLSKLLKELREVHKYCKRLRLHNCHLVRCIDQYEHDLNFYMKKVMEYEYTHSTSLI